MSMSMNKEMVEVNRRQFKAYAASKPINAVPSRTLTNATTKGLYTGNAMNCTRPGADDHAAIRSRGVV